MKCKLLHLFALAFTSIIFAQTKNEEAALAFFWGENDSYKNSVDIPDKWKNESAVIIYKNENYDFHKFGKNVTYKASVRKRIKLLDKAAVEEFSEFSYQKRFRSAKGYSKANESNNIIGVKIIKPNGDEIIIDIHKDAVVVDGETKIAIANLEVGDIIDYFYYSTEPFKSIEAFSFSPVEQTLNEEYPIMDYKLYFETENDFFINFNSYNDAPELTKIPTESKSIRRYELIANDIEKHKYERWFYPLVALPSYKFQVCFARSGKFEDRAFAYLPEKESIIKKYVSEEEVLEFYKKYTPYGNIGPVEDFIKENSFASEHDKIIAVYYFMRHHYLTRLVEPLVVREADILPMPFYQADLGAYFFGNSKEFVRYFMAFLYDFKFSYDVVIAKKRYDGPLDDLLIERNANVILRVNTSPPVYLEHFNIHSDANQFHHLLEGTDVYKISATKKKLDKITTGELPLSTYSQNESKRELTITLNSDFSGFNYKATNKYKGHQKPDYQFDKLIFKDYVDEDYKKYENKTFIESLKKKKWREKTTKELNALIEKLREKQFEKLKKSIEDELEFKDVSDYTFNINETGRYGFDTYFSFDESFNVNDALIKKAGPNYIIEIGKLIGGQIEITDEERDRIENIYMNYPRSYNYQITLNIPEGYSVSGLDKLNKSVDNKTGAFISTAKVEGDKLIITTSKQYKHNYIANSDWNLVTAFLDEAYQFTHEKILLKKN